MKVAAVTITYNRLDLTKRTVESFYSKTSVDGHLFVDNGSTDGTREYIERFDHIYFDTNYGITEAFKKAVELLKGYDLILKLDNDVETVTEGIVERMVNFFLENGMHHVCSPVDLNIDPAYKPKVLTTNNKNGYNVYFTTHTGGAFQMMPYTIADKLVRDYLHFKHGDMAIGQFCRKHGYRPAYLTDLEMRHIGINQSTPAKEYVL